MKSREAAQTKAFLCQERKTVLLWCGGEEELRRDVAWTVLLGSGTGVEAVDVSAAEVKWRWRSPRGVVDIAWDATSKACLACSAVDRSGILLKIDDGSERRSFKIGKHKAKRIHVLHGLDKLVVGGSHLVLWDAAKETNLIKYAGHATDVCALASSPDGGFVFSAAGEERHVAVWKAFGTDRNAVCLLPMDDPVICLDTAPLEEHDAFATLAVSSAGVAHVWRCNITKEQQLETTLWATIQVKPHHPKEENDARSDAILSAMLVKQSECMTVRIARGNVGFPSFEAIELGKCTSEPIVKMLDAVATTLIGRQGSQKDKKMSKKRAREAAVIGPDTHAETIQMTAHFSQVPREKATIASAPKRPALQSRKEEMTLGERLQVLQARMEKTETTAKNEKKGSLSASTASVLVQQINQSGDMELYNRAMRLPNDIVVGTVRQLSSHDAAKFLQLCVKRLQIRPKDASSIVNWIRAIVKTHAAVLMSAPDVQQSISGVHQMIETRLSCFDSLVALSGRVDLLLAQIEHRQKIKAESRQAMPQVEVTSSQLNNKAELMQVTVEVCMSDEEGEVEVVAYNADEDMPDVAASMEKEAGSDRDLEEDE